MAGAAVVGTGERDRVGRGGAPEAALRVRMGSAGALNPSLRVQRSSAAGGEGQRAYGRCRRCGGRRIANVMSLRETCRIHCADSSSSPKMPRVVKSLRLQVVPRREGTDSVGGDINARAAEPYAEVFAKL